MEEKTAQLVLWLRYRQLCYGSGGCVWLRLRRLCCGSGWRIAVPAVVCGAGTVLRCGVVCGAGGRCVQYRYCVEVRCCVWCRCCVVLPALCCGNGWRIAVTAAVLRCRRLCCGSGWRIAVPAVVCVPVLCRASGAVLRQRLACCRAVLCVSAAPAVVLRAVLCVVPAAVLRCGWRIAVPVLCAVRVMCCSTAVVLRWQ